MEESTKRSKFSSSAMHFEAVIFFLAVGLRMRMHWLHECVYVYFWTPASRLPLASWNATFRSVDSSRVHWWTARARCSLSPPPNPTMHSSVWWCSLLVWSVACACPFSVSRTMDIIKKIKKNGQYLTGISGFCQKYYFNQSFQYVDHFGVADSASSLRTTRFWVSMNVLTLTSNVLQKKEKQNEPLFFHFHWTVIPHWSSHSIQVWLYHSLWAANTDPFLNFIEFSFFFFFLICGWILLIDSMPITRCYHLHASQWFVAAQNMSLRLKLCDITTTCHTVLLEWTSHLCSRAASWLTRLEIPLSVSVLNARNMQIDLIYSRNAGSNVS